MNLGFYSDKISITEVKDFIIKTIETYKETLLSNYELRNEFKHIRSLFLAESYLDFKCCEDFTFEDDLHERIENMQHHFRIKDQEEGEPSFYAIIREEFICSKENDLDGFYGEIQQRIEKQ